MDTLDALRLYVSIADAGNLTAAARQRSVATSTVTVALQQLEAQAGASLMMRSTRWLTFTYEGTGDGRIGDGAGRVCARFQLGKVFQAQRSL
jgi:hypothetical protein